MKDLTTVNSFILLLHKVLERKAILTKDDVKVKLKIRDRLWSAVFLLDLDCLGIGVNKNGITYSFPEFIEKNEEPVCTIKEFLELEIKENRIDILELEQLIWELL
jgi:hypothetical protein